MLVTVSQMESISPSIKNIADFVNSLNILLTKYNIVDKKHILYFLAQYAHETMGFTKFSENMNYSSERLMDIFPKYFQSKEIARAYANKPELIGNRVYANRNGNGDEVSRDGYKYRGRGLCHLTFKSNYQSFQNETGIKVVDNPDLLLLVGNAIEAGCWYWNKAHCSKYVDNNDFNGLTKAINGGLNGLEERKQWLEKIKKILS